MTDRKLALRIFQLVETVRRDPIRGIGKPERLRHDAGNVWFRRISQEHRLVYSIGEGRIVFLQARHHY